MQKFVEHEPVVYTTKGAIPQSALHDVNEQAKSWTPPPDTKPKRLDKNCPFRGKAYDSRCSADCALFTGSGCGIVERKMGVGKSCPIPGFVGCGESCAFYKDGSCAMIK